MGLADVLAMLEHLPRVGNLLTRALPMLENYVPASLNAGATDNATRKALEDLGVELDRSAAAQISLAREVHEQWEQLALVLAELQTVRTHLEASTARAEALEKQLSLHRILLIVAALSSLFVFVLLLIRH